MDHPQGATGTHPRHQDDVDTGERGGPCINPKQDPLRLVRSGLKGTFSCDVEEAGVG